MFDVGIWEMGVIGVVALVVLGPERLPKVARTAGHMFGRLQRYVATVKSDINREMEMSELAKVKEEVQSAARSFEQSVTDHKRAVEDEARALETVATPSISPQPSVPAPSASTALDTPTQADILIGPTAETLPAGTAAPVAPEVPPALASAPAYASQAVMPMFDLGIEPPRVHRARNLGGPPSTAT
jgi:sec-independent protein translocase protein TatB